MGCGRGCRACKYEGDGGFEFRLDAKWVIVSILYIREVDGAWGHGSFAKGVLGFLRFFCFFFVVGIVVLLFCSSFAVLHYCFSFSSSCGLIKGISRIVHCWNLAWSRDVLSFEGGWCCSEFF